MVICGVDLKNTIKKKFPTIRVKFFFKDGETININSKLFTLRGNAKIILVVERTILIFYNTYQVYQQTTFQFVSKLKHTNTKLLNTRKTTTGLRKLEKYASVM